MSQNCYSTKKFFPCSSLKLSFFRIEFCGHLDTSPKYPTPTSTFPSKTLGLLKLWTEKIPLKNVHRHFLQCGGQSPSPPFPIIAGHDTQAHGMRRRQLRDGGLRGALVSVMRLSSMIESEVGCWVNPKMRGRDFFLNGFGLCFLGGWAENSLEVWNSHLFENILLGNDISVYDEWIWVGMVGAIAAMPLGINAMGTIGWWWWCHETLCLCCFSQFCLCRVKP